LAVRTISASTSLSIGGLPARRCPRDLSNLHATSLRYHAKMVSGRAAVATSSRALRPSRWPISPSLARSAPDSRRRPCNCAFRIRFSAIPGPARFWLEHQSAQRWRVTGDGPPFVRLGPHKIVYRLSDAETWAAGRTFAHRADELSRTVTSEGACAVRDRPIRVGSRPNARAPHQSRMTDLPPSLPVANGWGRWPGCGARAATLSDGSREGYQIYLDVIETAWGDDPVANLNPNLR
jgi:hypothetical protein